MIWPFTTINSLRTKELDANRQIAHLSARCELLSQENTRLQSQLTQYVDDLRKLSGLKDQSASSNGVDADPTPDIISTTFRRSEVTKALDEFRNRQSPLDMLDANSAWYRRGAELNNANGEQQNGAQVSQEASSD